MTPHAVWNFVEESDFCWVMLFYTTENKTMIEFNQHERLENNKTKTLPYVYPYFTQNQPESCYVFGLIAGY